MSFGNTPTTNAQGSLPANQIPISSVAVPGHSGGNLTAMRGANPSTDANGNETADTSVAVPDGGDVAQGTTTDVAYSGSGAGTVIALLKKLVAELSATLAVSGTVTETNSSSINTHLANIDSDSASLVTNTTGLATQATLAASKTDLDTIVTNTTGLATQATLASAKSDLDSIVTNTSNIPAKGQATMANSSPVVLASNQSNIPINIAQILGAALSATNPLISQAQYIAAVQAGKIYSASIGQKTYGTGVYAGMSIFNNSTAKNILILSFRIFNSGASQAAFLYLTTTDPAFGAALTPSNNLAGGAGSAIAANCSYALSGLSQPGTGLKYANQASTNTSATTGGEMIPRDTPILLPANAANGVAGYLAGTSGNSIFIDATWMEY